MSYKHLFSEISEKVENLIAERDQLQRDLIEKMSVINKLRDEIDSLKKYAAELESVLDEIS